MGPVPLRPRLTTGVPFAFDVEGRLASDDVTTRRYHSSQQVNPPSDDESTRSGTSICCFSDVDLAVSEALTRITFALAGLNESEPTTHIRQHPLRAEQITGEPNREDHCSVCGENGVTWLGDLKPLPLSRT